MVQFQSGLCNGPGTIQMDLPLFQFGGQICIFGFELIFALLERKDDLDQFSAAHMPQFTVCHNGTSVSKSVAGPVRTLLREKAIFVQKFDETPNIHTYSILPDEMQQNRNKNGVAVGFQKYF